MQFYPDGWKEKNWKFWLDVGKYIFWFRASWGQTCQLCLMIPHHLIFTLGSDAAMAEKATTMATMAYLELWDHQGETANCIVDSSCGGQVEDKHRCQVWGCRHVDNPPVPGLQGGCSVNTNCSASGQWLHRPGRRQSEPIVITQSNWTPSSKLLKVSMSVK